MHCCCWCCYRDVVLSLESTKASGEVVAPFDLTITSVNTELDDNPELVNEEPYEGGWLFGIEFNHDDYEAAFDGEFMTESEYEDFLKEEEH